jgi:hypothetical protein
MNCAQWSQYVPSLVPSRKSLIPYVCSQCSHYMYTHTHENTGKRESTTPSVRRHNWEQTNWMVSRKQFLFLKLGKKIAGAGGGGVNL